LCITGTLGRITPSLSMAGIDCSVRFMEVEGGGQMISRAQSPQHPNKKQKRRSFCLYASTPASMVFRGLENVGIVSIISRNSSRQRCA
jgi:hypothetical protein